MTRPLSPTMRYALDHLSRGGIGCDWNPVGNTGVWSYMPPNDAVERTYRALERRKPVRYRDRDGDGVLYSGYTITQAGREACV